MKIKLELSTFLRCKSGNVQLQDSHVTAAITSCVRTLQNLWLPLCGIKRAKAKLLDSKSTFSHNHTLLVTAWLMVQQIWIDCVQN